jgi:hypothetical protein
MNHKAKPPAGAPVDPAFGDDDVTRPVSLALIARLAAKDPSVQLKIGVLEWSSDLQIGDEEKTPTD